MKYVDNYETELFFRLPKNSITSEFWDFFFVLLA